MSLNFQAGGFPDRLPGDGDSDTSRPVEEWQLERRRPERLAEGVLACPACELPIALAAALAASKGLNCPFCGLVAPAREYFRLGAASPQGSRVAVIATF